MEKAREGFATLERLERNPTERLDRQFRELSMAHVRAAHRLAFGILGDNLEAEDACQDALTSAWRRRASLRDVDRFEAWFSRILVNVCRDRLRRRARTPMIVDQLDRPASGDLNERTLDRDFLGQALAALDPDLRIVVVLRYWLDLTVEDIADRLAIPSGTVKSRLNRSMGELRAALEALE